VSPADATKQTIAWTLTDAGTTGAAAVATGIFTPQAAGTLRVIFNEYGFSTKTVTVKVPADATGYGTVPTTYSGYDIAVNWGSGFRCGGWDGTAFVNDGVVNTFLTLTITTIDETDL
jgi:hypothetical protein